VPNFAADYTAGKAKYASTPAALKGFQYGEDVFKAGYLNPDFAVATFEEAVVKVATGEGAHYPMLSFAVSTIQTLSPENVNNVGFFAIPGDDAAKNGLTVWTPAGIYIPKTSKHPEEAKKFLAYVASVAGCDIQTATVGAAGPYVVKGCTLPTDVPTITKDVAAYFTGGAQSPALEFLSPVKGPSLDQIGVQVGSGITDAKTGATQYDKDTEKQAQQLGLPGW
jgi:raffinose/stachyose/melibiose transport system substrate-binding protein